MANLKGKGKGEVMEANSNKRKPPVRKLVVEGGRSGYRCTRGDCRMVFHSRKTFNLHIAKHEREDKNNETHSVEQVPVHQKKTRSKQEEGAQEVVLQNGASDHVRGKRTSFSCKWEGCGRVFNTKNRFNDHLKQHAEVSTDEDDNEEAETNWEKEIRALNGRKAKDEELEREPNTRKLPVRKLVVEGGRSGYRCTRGDCRMVYYTRKTFQFHIAKHDKEDIKDGTHSEEEEEEKEVEVPRKKTRRTQEARRVEKMKVVPNDRMSVTAGGKSRRFPCHKAGSGRLFNSKKSLNIHKRDHEQEEREEVSQDEEDPENLRENGKIDIPWASTLHCGVCESKPQFSSMAELESHRELTHPNYFNSKQCPCCQKSFGKVYDMNAHLRIHTREKPFGCPTCDKCFSTKQDARYHYTYVHTTVRSYPCSKCEKSFKTSSNLNNHTKFVHEKETYSKYACTEPSCTSKFTKKDHLLNHIETHKKPLERQWYECAPCQKMFMRRTSLLKHVRVHHNPEKEDKQCLYCKLMFPSETLLLKHIKEKRHDTEKPFNCAYCQLQFVKQGNLRVHLKTRKHLNTVETYDEVKNHPECSQALAQEKVALAPIFECKYCESTYSSEELLTHHLELLHSIPHEPSERSFPCSVDGCTKEFCTKAIRTAHIRKLHAGKGKVSCTRCRVEFKIRKYLDRHLTLGRCERAVKLAVNRTQKKSTCRPKQAVELPLNTRTKTPDAEEEKLVGNWCSA